MPDSDSIKLTQLEQVVLQLMNNELQAANAVLQGRIQALRTYVMEMGKSRGLEIGKWRVSDDMKHFIKMEEKPDLVIAQPGQVEQVAQASKAANGLHVVG